MILGSSSYYLPVSFHNPVPIIIFREMLFLSLLIWLTFNYLDNKYILISGLVFSFLLAHVVLISGFTQLTVFGLKTFFPLVLLFAIIKPNFKSLDAIFFERLIKILFFGNFIFQIVNLFFGRGIYGKFFFGLNARNPGFFLYPAAAAFFILVIGYIYSSLKKQISFAEIGLFFLSLILCASLTGLGGAAVLVFLRFKKLQVKKIGFALLFLLFGLAYVHAARMSMIDADYLRLLNNRPAVSKIEQSKPSLTLSVPAVQGPDENQSQLMKTPAYLKDTGGGRIQVFIKALKRMDFLPTQFGMYTNAAVTYGNGIIADSLFTSFLGNLGIFWSILIGFFLIVATAIIFLKKQNIGIIFLVLVCALGLNIQETGLSIFLAIVSRLLIEPSLDRGYP